MNLLLELVKILVSRLKQRRLNISTSDTLPLYISGSVPYNVNSLGGTDVFGRLSVFFFYGGRMIMVQREAYLTREGLEKLQAELEHIRTVSRQAVAERIQEAKEIGGTVDNAEYDEAKNEQAFLEGRVLTLEGVINNAVVIPTEQSDGHLVKVGSVVLVATESGFKQRYTIVGSVETDPQGGRISNESPVGKALLGRNRGDEVEVQAPAGTIRLKIVAVE